MSGGPETLRMPRLGETMEEGRLVAWLKRPGDAFRRGEVIAEVETDKTVVELPALADGVLVEVLVAEGTDVAVDDPIARIEVAASATADADRPSAAEPPRTAPSHRPVSRPEAATPAAGPRVRATPLARRLARTAGIDLAAVPGTGRRGRVEAADVRLLRGYAPPAGPGAGGIETRVDCPGGALAVTTWGEGQPLLLIHGFAGDRASWGSFPSLLARRGRRVIVPDLPAHGATSLEAATLDELAAPLAALAGDGADIVGFSLGGAIAVRLAGRVRPRRLTLVAPAGIGLEIDGEFVAAMASRPSAGAIAHLLRRVSLRGPELTPEALAAKAHALGRGRLGAIAALLATPAGQGIDVLPELRALAARLPVRVAWGLSDAIIPWEHVRRLPPAVAIHLFDAGHLVHADAPDDLAALLAG